MKENNPIAFASTFMVMMINVFLFIIGGCYVFAAILFGIYLIGAILMLLFGDPRKDTSNDKGQKPRHKRKRESGGSFDNGWNGYTDPNDLPTDGCGNSQW